MRKDGNTDDADNADTCILNINSSAFLINHSLFLVRYFLRILDFDESFNY